MRKVRYRRWLAVVVLFLTATIFALSTTPSTQAQGPAEDAAPSYNFIEVQSPSADERPGAVTIAPEDLAPMDSMAAAAGSETEPNNTTATANAVTLPSVTKGNVYPANDLDYYSVSLTAGSTFFAATQTSFDASGSGDSVLTLYASDGTTVVETDNNNGSFNASSSSLSGVPIATTGTYYLQVRHNLATGTIRPYYLYVATETAAATPEVEPNDSNATAMPLPASGYVSGSLSAQTDADWYSFTANAGDTIYYSADADPERDSTDTPLRIGVGIFANNILVVNDLIAGVDPDSETFLMTVKNSGTYYAYVDSGAVAVTAPGTYRFSLTVLPAESRAACTTFNYTGGTVPIVDVGRMTTTVNIPSPMIVGDINVTLNLTHTFMQDLDFSLVSPQGNYNGLATDIGAGTVGGPLTTMNLTLDDEAAIPPSFTIVDGLVLQPELAHRLSWFDGEQAQGNWRLVIDDDVTGDTGNLLGWSLDICPQEVINPAPTCPVGTQQVTVFSTDFESGAAGFTHSGTLDEWELGLPTPPNPAVNPIYSCNSGSSCWKTDLDGTYELSSSQDLLSPAFDLSDPDYVSSWVQWSQRYQMESASFDHYYVDGQNVGGLNPTRYFEWLDATMTNSVGGPTAITRHESAGWAVFRGSLNNYLSDTDAQVRWHLDSDNLGNFSGAAVDDVTVFACETIPATATPTATNTATNTPVPPTNTPTSTFTNTPVPPTNTPTSTFTNTPVPPTSTPTNTATVTPTGSGLCATPNIPITDNLPAGVTSVLNVATSGTITDLNVSLDVTHSWIGDVAITLSHNATTAELFDRPGYSGTGFGCSGDNLNNTADDEAATPFETSCSNTIPAYPAGNSYIPGDPSGPNLAAFDGQDINGAWTLTASDGAAGDTGTLNSWCLVPTLGTGPTSTATATTQATSTTTSTAQATSTATSTAQPSNTPTVTATGSVPPTATPTVSATPGAGGTYCSTTPVTIPDNLPAGANSVLNVSDSTTISDLNVSLDVTHSWIGDVVITLNHSATTAELFDRPGYSGTGFGCSGDDLDNIADDEAATAFETSCANTVPAYPAGNSYIPGDPSGPNLAAFDGQSVNGAWTLNVSDNAAGDTGTLNGWCLIVGGGGPTATPTVSPTATQQGNAPDIDVDPASVTETHNSPPQTTNRTLAIDNVGNATLDWSITEEAGALVQGKGDAYVPSVVGNAPAAQDGNTLSSGVAGATFPHSLVPQAGSTTVTHSSTQDIETGNSVSCNAGGLHTDNSYYRVFDLAGDFGITDTFTVNEISFAVEQATGATGTQPVSVILYTLTGPFTLANLTEIGREDISLADTAGTIETAAFSPAVVVPVNAILVVEIFTPSGQATGNSFFIGSNTAAQTDPSYLRAADCGITQPTDTAAIGFPDMHIVINATGDVGGGGGACTASDIPWLTLSPTSGSTAPGGSSNVTLTFNSASLAPGTYTGNLCIESNDPDENPVDVPVTLNVGPVTAVTLGSLTQVAGDIRIADFAAAGILLLAGGLLMFRRRK